MRVRVQPQSARGAWAGGRRKEGRRRARERNGDPSPYTAEEPSEAFPPQLRRLECMVTFLSVDTVQALVGALPSESMPQLKAVRLSETNLFLPSPEGTRSTSWRWSPWLVSLSYGTENLG